MHIYKTILLETKHNVQNILQHVRITKIRCDFLYKTCLDNTISDDEIIFNGFNLLRRDQVG